MEQKEISIQEALPILKEMLNISGLTNLMGKSVSWFAGKEVDREVSFIDFCGFTDENIELINKSINHIADECESHLLDLPTDNINRKEYNEYVSRELKEVRKSISFVYLREKYTTIGEQTFSRKLRLAPNRNNVFQFTTSDIVQINAGLKAISEQLRSMKIIL